MMPSAFALFGLVQVQDAADVLARGDRLLQGARAAYEGSRTPEAPAGARFTLEEARPRFTVVVDGRGGGVPRNAVGGSPAPDRRESARRTWIACPISSLERVPVGSDRGRNLR